MVCKLSSWHGLLFRLMHAIFKKALVQLYRFTVGGSWWRLSSSVRAVIRICGPLTVSHELTLRAYSSVGLERPPDKREVGGSIPLRPTRKAVDSS
jgi:hypothetical protein